MPPLVREEKQMILGFGITKRLSFGITKRLSFSLQN